MKNIGYCAIVVVAAALAACAQSEAEREMGKFETTLPSGQLNLDANQVTPQSRSEYVYFAGSDTAVSREAATTLNGFRDAGVDAVWIYAPRGDTLTKDRALAIGRLFRGMGVSSDKIYTTTDTMASKDTYRVDIAYASVRGPSCPNWSSSGITSYQNRSFSQMGCANANNIGQMVKNPNDLVMGRGNIRPSSERTTQSITTYNSGAAAPASSSSSSNSGGSANSASSSASSGAPATP